MFCIKVLLIFVSFTIYCQKTILVIGDSYCIGNISFITQLSKDTSYIVTNLSFKGNAVYQQHKQNFDTTKRYDYVILFLGLNDIFTNQSIQQIKLNYTILIKKIYLLTDNLIIYTIPCLFYNYTFDKNKQYKTNEINVFLKINKNVVDINEIIPYNISVFELDMIHMKKEIHRLLFTNLKVLL